MPGLVSSPRASLTDSLKKKKLHKTATQVRGGLDKQISFVCLLFFYSLPNSRHCIPALDFALFMSNNLLNIMSEKAQSEPR